MKRILITGEKGFIGSNLYNALSADSENQLLTIDLDVSDERFISKALEVSPEFIYHLASPCSIIQFNRSASITKYISF